MLALNDQQLVQLLVQAIVFGVIWGLAFYYIRKGLNKRNFTENAEAKREAFKWDAIYGGLATAVSVIAKKFVWETIQPMLAA
jgi:hypothetical protein